MIQKIKSISELENYLIANSAASDIAFDNKRAGLNFLSAKDVRFEVSLIARILINGYCGWPFHSEIVKRRVLNRLTRIFNHAEDMRPMDFMDALRPIFAKIPDNHLSLVYETISIKTKLGHKITDVGKNIASKQEKISSKWFDNILVLAYSALSELNDQDIRQNYDNLRQIDNAEAVIIDLRGNKGGNSKPLDDLARYLYGADTPSVLKSYIRNTEEAKIIRKLRQNNLDKNIQGHSDPIVLEDFTNKQYPEFAGVRKPIYIITDGRVSSSAELFLTKMLRHPFAKRVGADTAGCEIDGYVFNIKLPKSGIIMRVGQVHRELEQKNFELRGYKPHIKVADKNDALQAANQIIRIYMTWKKRRDKAITRKV